MGTREVLEKALDILNEKGWCQGRGIAPDGSVCAMQAVSDATPGHDYETYLNALKVPEGFESKDNMHMNAIVAYNDNPATSFEDVKLMFKRSIEEAD